MTAMFTLNATLRADIGKGASRRLRREETIPAILYGKHITPISLNFQHRDLLRLLNNKHLLNQVLNLDVEGTQHSVIIKNIQKHVYKNKVLHVDMQAVSAEDRIQATIPLEFINADKSVGVKKGGSLSITLKQVNVRCNAVSIPEKILVDLTDLDVDQIIHLSSLNWPVGVESSDLLLGKQHDLSVAAIHSIKDTEPSGKGA
jgi:large subunit ribosomal protein L25